MSSILIVFSAIVLTGGLMALMRGLSTSPNTKENVVPILDLNEINSFQETISSKMAKTDTQSSVVFHQSGIVEEPVVPITEEKVVAPSESLDNTNDVIEENVSAEKSLDQNDDVVDVANTESDETNRLKLDNEEIVKKLEDQDLQYHEKIQALESTIESLKNKASYDQPSDELNKGLQDLNWDEWEKKCQSLENQVVVLNDSMDIKQKKFDLFYSEVDEIKQDIVSYQSSMNKKLELVITERDALVECRAKYQMMVVDKEDSQKIVSNLESKVRKLQLVKPDDSALKEMKNRFMKIESINRLLQTEKTATAKDFEKIKKYNDELVEKEKKLYQELVKSKTQVLGLEKVMRSLNHKMNEMTQQLTH